jgi:hypothetical protein
MAKFTNERVALDNIIRISAQKNIADYIASVIMRIQPAVYQKYGCIKLRFTKDLEGQVKYLCKLCWHVGLVPQKKVKMKDGIPMDKGVLIADAREIILKKIGAIEFEDNEEFDGWWNKTSWEIEE